jgi:hypothetical protein
VFFGLHLFFVTRRYLIAQVVIVGIGDDVFVEIKNENG